MTALKTQVQVLISSPGGLEAERKVVESAIEQYNKRNSDGNIFVVGKDWLIDVVPDVGPDA